MPMSLMTILGRFSISGGSLEAGEAVGGGAGGGEDGALFMEEAWVKVAPWLAPSLRV
jgi:hypothetical protein